MRKNLRQKLLIGVIVVTVILAMVLLKYSWINDTNLSGLILDSDEGYSLYLDNHNFIVLDGMLGNMAVSKDKNRGVFFRENQNGQVEIAEVTFDNAQIRIVADAEILQKSMWAADETDYSGSVKERPESIKYVNGENLISFSWNNALYQMNLTQYKIDCIVEKLDRAEFALEGQDYEWVNENEIVYVTNDEKGASCIVKYDLQTQNRQFVHYGTGVGLFEDGENILCYQTYIKDSITWEHFHEFSVVNINSLEVERSYTYREVRLFKPEASIVFQYRDNDLVLWSEKGNNCLYSYDFVRGKIIRKKLLGKRIYSIL